MMSISEVISNLISDPINGPFEGEDYCIDNNTIEVSNNNARLAANIMRQVNASELFDDKLVKLGLRGDSILLGFDTMSELEAVYSTNVGPGNTLLAEVKQDEDGKFCVYVDKVRAVRMYSKISKAKAYIKTLKES